MVLLWVFIAVAAVLNTMQSGSSQTLQKQMNHPTLPAVVTYLTGGVFFVLATLVYDAVSGKSVPTLSGWRELAATGPWWMWVGGLLGAVYVMAMVNASGKAGAGVFIGVSVTASVMTSLVLDHFALMGFKQHTASVPRLIGAGLMICGLVLIGKF